MITHYLCDENSQNVPRSYFYCKGYDWKRQELDLTDEGYGMVVIPTENPAKFNIVHTSMGFEAQAERENGLVSARVKPQDWNLLFILVDTGLFTCDGYQFFDNGEHLKVKFNTPQWKSPKKKN